MNSLYGRLGMNPEMEQHIIKVLKMNCKYLNDTL